MARAAKAAGVQHVIWSTLEDTRELVPLDDDRMPTLQDKYKVPHFDAKGATNHLFTDAGVPTTFLHTSFYWENFIYFGMGPQRGEDGMLRSRCRWATRSCPASPPRTSARSRTASSRRGDGSSARPSASPASNVSGEEMAAEFSKALGEEVRYNAVPPDVFRSFGFPGADELGNMFQFKRDFEAEYCGSAISTWPAP